MLHCSVLTAWNASSAINLSGLTHFLQLVYTETSALAIKFLYAWSPPQNPRRSSRPSLLHPTHDLRGQAASLPDSPSLHLRGAFLLLLSVLLRDLYQCIFKQGLLLILLPNISVHTKNSGKTFIASIIAPSLIQVSLHYPSKTTTQVKVSLTKCWESSTKPLTNWTKLISWFLKIPYFQQPSDICYSQSVAFFNSIPVISLPSHSSKSTFVRI